MANPIEPLVVEVDGRRGPFRVTHAMILIAAAALALAWLRSARAAWFGPIDTTSAGGGSGSLPVFMARLAAATEATLPYLAMATLAVVVLRLWPPRPALGRLVTQPGFLACAVATLFLAAPVGGSLTWVVFRGLLHGPAAARVATTQAVAQVYEALADWGYLIGLAVAVAWVANAAVRGWRPEPNALDRAGRALGCGWVVLAPLAIAAKFGVFLGIF